MLYEEIKSVYPEIHDSQFSLQDDGEGPYIKEWNYHLPPPTQQQIDAAMPVLLKEKALMRINASYEIAMRELTQGYPESEVQSWAKQESEARSWIASGSTVSTPWIDAAAAARGIPKIQFVNRIMTKAVLFSMIHGDLTGKRQRLEDQINALGPSATAEQLDAIVW